MPSRYFLHKDYNLLFIDFRYFGKSGGSYTTVGKQEVLDLLAAIKYLHQRGLNDIGIWGLSLGGAVALMAAQQSTAIKAIVAESSYARLDLMVYEYYPIPLFQYPLAELTRWWGILFLGVDVRKISPMDAVSKLKIPLLLIHSKSDKSISFQQALLLQKALINNPNAYFMYAEDGDHGALTDDNVEAITEFFRKYLYSHSR